MDTSEKQYEIVFTNDSILEMDSIYNYITRRLYNSQAAKRLMKKVEDSIYNLKTMPRKHTVIKKFESLELEYRRILVNNYAIIYTINEKEKIVYIVHMYYGKSNYLDNL